MSEKTIPLARQGVFATVQGEGVLLGLPMIFIRLAGCSVACSSHCFHGSTRIRMGDFSTRPISEVGLGDVVLSYDEASHTFLPKRVSAVMRGVASEVWRIETGGRPTFATGEHPFLVRDRGWVRASDLRTGDRILHLSMSELRRMWNPMKDQEVAARQRATRAARGLIVRPPRPAGPRLSCRERMLRANPMKDPAVAIRSHLNRKDLGERSNVERFVETIGSDLGLRYVGDGSLVVAFKAPDFVIDGTNKLVEVWDQAQTDFLGRGGDWQSKRRACFEAEGYEVLFLPCTPYPMHDRVGSRKPARREARDAEVARVRAALAEYARNGHVVRSATRINSREQPKAWVALAGSLLSTLTVYNLEVEDTHTYVANGKVVHNCDTDYRVHRRVTAAELLDELLAAAAGLPGVQWIWATGGEPTDHDLSPVLRAVRAAGLKAALATAGTREVDLSLWDFVSVSPHAAGPRWVQRSGSQVNLVPDLGPLTLDDIASMDLSGFPEGARFVTPLADRGGRPSNVQECVEFVSRHPGFRLGVQAHKSWVVW